MYDIFTKPTPYVAVLLLCMAAAFTGMMAGPRAGRSDATIEAYREVGREIFFVFLPFVFYSVLATTNESLLAFLAGTELPMASAIVSGMSILSINKGIKASKGRYPMDKFATLMKWARTTLIACLILVAWLFFDESPWPWFSVINLGVVIAVITLAFGVIAAMSRMEKVPQEVGIAP
ncbi:hypothetical protein soil367_09405 [Hydrocarboniclastica marina]|uniref:DUF2975 domain-containing protein n=2 Tax=Hydrocarboniclastica marina TaxID=2259620 RepID=A0A4V1D8R7_9ALTE|nr:hypothetical protein soil367_09405 [Hydrocarboniclastica marina]